MLRFQVHHNGRPVSDMDLAGTYLVGSDGVPLRAELEFRDSQIVCAKRADGPAGLAVLWPIPGCGAILSETGRLMDRDQPYNLLLELVRGRLTRINQKREDWGLFDYEGVEQVAGQIDKARDLFIGALCADSPIEQSRAAEEALKVAFVAGEQLCQFHADLFLARRKQTPGFTKRVFGCAVDLHNNSDEYRERFKESVDFAYIPVPWRLIEPRQQTRDWQLIDSWIEWLAKSRIPVRMGPLVNLTSDHIPDWLSQYEGDYESVRSALVEHVRRTVERYGNYVFCWDVVSGIHAANAFNFTFEQIMDLTRVTVSLVKQLAARSSQVAIDLVAPWGEYYARNQRTIPPMFYADMISQSGVGFDGIAAQFVFGAPQDGMFVRDMFQISDKLDRLGNLGKPVHITAVQVPSKMIGEKGSLGGGCWLRPWDEAVQAKWIKGFYTVALSKPFVDSITWWDLADRPSNQLIPFGGLLNGDLTPKPAYKAIKDFRAELAATARRPPGHRSR
ncbi:MAG: endo-1,4-beta-xylanase [Phycisphaerae bacterium]|nr:endo-1,4-beta-xylanase [Phycisphaerae bacterium]